MTENSPVPPLVVRENFRLDDRIRGVPPGTTWLDSSLVAAEHWHPADGRMALPVLTLDEAAFAANRDLFLRYAREHNVAIAPHAKTPMAPDLARSLVEAGAWGTTVADIRQATVMLKAGLTRLIIANEATVKGGAVSEIGQLKNRRLSDVGTENHLPSISLVESAGADLPV